MYFKLGMYFMTIGVAKFILASIHIPSGDNRQNPKGTRAEKKKVAELEEQLKTAKDSAKEEADKAIAELQKQMETAKKKPVKQSPRNRKNLPICKRSLKNPQPRTPPLPLN